MKTTQEVSPGAYLDTKYLQILKAVEKYEVVLEDEPSEDSSKTVLASFKKKLATRTKRLQISVDEYIGAANDFMKQGAIASDFKGVLDKTHMPLFTHSMVDSAISNLGDNSYIGFTKMKGDITKAVISKEGVVRGRLESGVKYLFNAKTGKLSLMYGNVRRAVEIVYANLNEVWVAICETIEGMYSEVKEKSIGFFELLRSKIEKANDNSKQGAQKA